MKYQIVMMINKSIELPLFEVDIPKEEAQNVADAATCEMKYGDLDWEI